MKKNNILWAVLPMMAALVMTACSNDDNANESPVQQNASKTIPYTVTVNGGASTRATVESDNKTLYFAAGDKLYVTGTDIKGELDIQTGTGTASATFSGDLTYSGSGSPAADLSLTATLVSAQQTNGSEVTINATTGAVTVNYPTTSYCGDVAIAVQKYSNLTGTSTYSTKSFSLTQQTAFLNFAITFEDGTTTGTGLSAVVSNGGSALCTANVTTTTESEKVVAKFVLPVAKGTTLSSANVKFGDKAAISFGASQTLDGKVYNVTKTQADPDYLKWNATQKKLVATEIPTDATAVSNASGDVNWVAGTYVVDGNVTISGVISLQGAVNLIIKDGAKLTVGKINGANYDLSIFGQSNMTGELVVRHNTQHAIQNLSTLEIHSCKVTAIGVLNARYGFNDIGTINVYGGSVDAKATGGTGEGICLRDAGSMNIYGGLVKAEGKGSSNNYCYGVEGNATITVYGGKLWVGSPNKQAFRSNVTLTTGASFTGKIQTSDDNTTWTDWTTVGTPTTKYVKVE